MPLLAPLPPSHDGKSDQQTHDGDSAGDVRNDGNHPGDVAGVRPDEADDRPHDKHDDCHR